MVAICGKVCQAFLVHSRFPFQPGDGFPALCQVGPQAFKAFIINGLWGVLNAVRTLNGVNGLNGGPLFGPSVHGLRVYQPAARIIANRWKIAPFQGSGDRRPADFCPVGGLCGCQVPGVHSVP